MEEKKEKVVEKTLTDEKRPVENAEKSKKEVTRGVPTKEKELADWEITQKKAFTHWVNSYLSSKGLKIEELGTDFKNTTLFITFLECLTGNPFEAKYNKKPRMKVHHLENAQLSIDYLKNTLKVPDITISPDEIVDGLIKMMLGFCWVLLRFFGKQQMQRDRGDKNDNTSFEDSILNWVRDEVKDYSLDISSFKTSFNDGKALLALCHKFNPNLIDYHKTDLSDPRTNAENGLRLLEQQYNLPALLNVDNLIAGKESDKNIVLYLSLLHGAWRRETEKKKVSAVAEEKVLTLQEKLTMLQEESRTLKEEHTVLEEKVEVLQKLLQQETEHKVELKETKEEETARVTSEREELRKAKDKLEKEKSELAAEHEELLQKLKRQQKAREDLEEAVKREQAKAGIAIDFLRKNLLEHLRDLDYWKEFLERERDYRKDDITLLKEDNLKSLSYDDQVFELSKAVGNENTRLEKILEERERYAKELEEKKKEKKPEPEKKLEPEKKPEPEKKTPEKKSPEKKKKVKILQENRLENQNNHRQKNQLRRRQVRQRKRLEL